MREEEIRDEACSFLGREITDEEWETEEYIKRGGFESWDFGI